LFVSAGRRQVADLLNSGRRWRYRLDERAARRIIFETRRSRRGCSFGGKEMAEREEVGDGTIRIPEQMIETINKLLRTSRQMLPEIGREPTSEELAQKLEMPLEKVHKLLKIARQPISLKGPIGD
jgi:Sigma-70 region 3